MPKLCMWREDDALACSTQLETIINIVESDGTINRPWHPQDLDGLAGDLRQILKGLRLGRVVINNKYVRRNGVSCRRDALQTALQQRKTISGGNYDGCFALCRGAAHVDGG